jgi:hypothetical protein
MFTRNELADSSLFCVGLLSGSFGGGSNVATDWQDVKHIVTASHAVGGGQPWPVFSSSMTSSPAPPPSSVTHSVSVRLTLALATQARRSLLCYHSTSFRWTH